MWFLTLVLLLTTSLLCYAGYIFLVVDKRQEKQERPPPRSTPGAQNTSLSTCTRPALCCALAAPCRLLWQQKEQSVWRAPRCPSQRVGRARRCRRIVAGRLHAPPMLLCLVRRSAEHADTASCEPARRSSGAHRRLRLLRQVLENPEVYEALDDKQYNFELPIEIDDYDELRESKPPDKRTLPLALLKRAMADIPLIEQLERDHPRMVRLFNRGLLPFGIWEQLLEAERMMDEEVSFAQTHAALRDLSRAAVLTPHALSRCREDSTPVRLWHTGLTPTTHPRATGPTHDARPQQRPATPTRPHRPVRRCTRCRRRRRSCRRGGGRACLGRPTRCCARSARKTRARRRSARARRS